MRRRMNSRFGTFSDRCKLFFRSKLPLPVHWIFEIEPSQVFALFPMLARFLSDVHWRPICHDVRTPEPSARFGGAGRAVRSQALCFRVVLVPVQEHEEVLHHARLLPAERQLGRTAFAASGRSARPSQGLTC